MRTSGERPLFHVIQGREAHNFRARGQWLFAEHVFICFQSFDSLVSVHCGHRRHDNGLEAGMAKHGVVIFVKSNTMWLQVLFGPLELLGRRSAGGDEGGAWCAIEEV